MQHHATHLDGRTGQSIDKTLNFPGAFKGTLLSGEIAGPSPFPEITYEQIYQAFDLYRKCLHEIGGASGLGFTLLPAMRLLALRDPTGEEVRKVEEGFLKLAAAHKEVLADTRGAPALPAGAEKALALVKGRPDLLGVQCEPTTKPFGGTELVPVSVEHYPTSASLLQLLGVSAAENIASEVVFLQGKKIDGFGKADIQTLRKGVRSSIERLLELSTDVLKDEETLARASYALAQSSPLLRIIQFVDDWSELDRELAPTRQAVRGITEKFPAFPPMIFMHGAPGTLFQSTREADWSLPVTPADDKSLDANTFILLQSSGLVAGWAHYDYKWGHLVVGNRYKFGEAIENAVRAQSPDDTVRMSELKRLIDLFPVMDWPAMRRATIQLQQDEKLTPEATEYLSEREAWFGPRLRPTKPWLLQVDQPLKPGLARVIAALRDPEGALLENTKDAENLGIYGNSLFQNGQAEGFMAQFVTNALETKATLETARLGRYGERTAAGYLATLAQTEGIENFGRVFDSHDDGSVTLTLFGRNYLEDLIDPEKLGHVTGDNDIERVEEKARERTRRGW